MKLDPEEASAILSGLVAAVWTVGVLGVGIWERDLVAVIAAPLTGAALWVGAYMVFTVVGFLLVALRAAASSLFAHASDGVRLAWRRPRQARSVEGLERVRRELGLPESRLAVDAAASWAMEVRTAQWGAASQVAAALGAIALVFGVLALSPWVALGGALLVVAGLPGLSRSVDLESRVIEALGPALVPETSSRLSLPGGSEAHVEVSGRALRLRVSISGFGVDVLPVAAERLEEEASDPDIGDPVFDLGSIVRTRAGGPAPTWLPAPLRTALIAALVDGGELEDGTLSVALRLDDGELLATVDRARVWLAVVEVLGRAHAARSRTDRVVHVLSVARSDSERAVVLATLAPEDREALGVWAAEGSGPTRLDAARLVGGGDSFAAIVDDLQEPAPLRAEAVMAWVEANPATASRRVAEAAVQGDLALLGALDPSSWSLRVAGTLGTLLLGAEVSPAAGPWAAWFASVEREGRSLPIGEARLAAWITAVVGAPSPAARQPLHQLSGIAPTDALRELARRTVARVDAALDDERGRLRGGLAIAEPSADGGLSESRSEPEAGGLARPRPRRERD